jgi:hypothetical protein
MSTPRIQRTSKTRSAAYLRMAGEFSRGVATERADGNLRLAGVAAVHCLISAADAVLVFHLGLRSKGQDHREAQRLLSGLDLPGRREAMEQFADVLRLKSDLEYNPEGVREEDVDRLEKQARRFLDWAARSIGTPLPPIVR